MLVAVTGAFGYSGRAIAERLLARGERVRTLTNSPQRPHDFGDRIDVCPLAFDDPPRLARSLAGSDVLVNTYWVRFNHRLFTFDQAVANTRTLFAAAKAAGVRRIVHTSILKPEQGRGLAYYDGKLRLERDLESTGLPHAILRPGVLFGRGDILVNNIAWLLRHLPLFGLFGDGRYALAPLHVDDFAAIALRAIDAQPGLPRVIDCHGPESFPYRDLVRQIAAIIGVRRPIVRVPPWLGHIVGRLLNPLLKDVVITREEIDGLMRGLLASDQPSLGTTRLTDWANAHRDALGRRYAGEVGRRVRRSVAYEQV
ncbi:MAG: NAD(P)H-binding protein [Phycisphaerae bacterium]